MHAAVASIESILHGSVSEQIRDQATGEVAEILARHHIDSGVRIRLSGPTCGSGPTLIQVNLRICGAPARIQVPGRSPAKAVSNAVARLDAQLRRLSRNWESWPWPDPIRRPLSMPGEAAVTRVKAVKLHMALPCQATAAMDAMDYDVHLFTDTDSGQDAIVYRAGPTGIRLARQHTMRPPSMPHTLPLTVSPHKVPALTADHAAARLADCWLPFLFFTDAGSGRGSLLYRRYDGGLTLIRPRKTAGAP